ncbi:MAG: hypothetical protein IJ546_00430 [Prevotella sp.]|nr:hypothetical protein [Prevotella sp.]
MSDFDSKGCGCSVIILIVVIFVFKECTEKIGKDYGNSSQKTEASYYGGSFSEDELTEEDKRYLTNSLATGATPYAEYYGENYYCPYAQCSGIKVTAPRESDIVVIIKKNNKDGKVIAHGYIKAGSTYLFDVPDGTYQTFFYYGEGWNPNKDMGNGLKGGFVKDEIVSKDNPQNVFSAVLSYVLQLQSNGNFQTKGSNKSECF